MWGRWIRGLEEAAVEIVVTVFVVGLENVGIVGFVGGGGGSGCGVVVAMDLSVAGVEINHRVKSKSIAAEGDVVLDIDAILEGVASGEPLVKEEKIISNGTISCE